MGVRWNLLSILMSGSRIQAKISGLIQFIGSCVDTYWELPGTLLSGSLSTNSAKGQLKLVKSSLELDLEKDTPQPRPPPAPVKTELYSFHLN